MSGWKNAMPPRGGSIKISLKEDNTHKSIGAPSQPSVVASSQDNTRT